MKRLNNFFGLPLLTLILVIVACGGSAEPTATQPSQAQATAAPKAEETTLRVGTPFLSRSPATPRGGFGAIRFGIGETLFKLSKDELKSEPWLVTGAQRIPSAEGMTWQKST